MVQAKQWAQKKKGGEALVLFNDYVCFLPSELKSDCWKVSLKQLSYDKDTIMQ